MWFLREKKKKHKGLAGGMLKVPPSLKENWPDILKQLGYCMEEGAIPANKEQSLSEVIMVTVVKGGSRVEFHLDRSERENDKRGHLCILVRDFPKDYPLAAEIEEHLVKAGCTRYFGGIAKYESSWRELTSNNDHKSGE